MDTSLITEKLADVFQGPLLEENEFTNVSKSERILSIGSGSFIFVRGVANLFSNPLLALGEVVVGSFLIHRGVTGQCKIKPMIDTDPVQMETVLIMQ